jgi:hypothetical protein
MSSIAVFLILGGATAIAASSGGKKISGKKIQKNSIPGNRLKTHSVTGTQINLAKLGTVPLATQATMATSATNATNASNVESVKPFSKGANNQELVTLVKTANFELAGFCDPNDETVAPGLTSERKGTVMVIYNRSGTLAFADSSDDENYKMGQNQAVGFNYQDNGDGGLAMTADGHFLAAPDFANEVADTSFENEPEAGDNYQFPTACHFAGAAFVG